MTQQQLLQQLRHVEARYRKLWFWYSLAWFWLIAAALVSGIWGWTALRGLPLSGSHFWLLGIVAVLVTGLPWLLSALAHRPYWLAQQVEKAFPDLHARLLTALQQQPQLPDGQFGYLQSTVIAEAWQHSQQHPWSSIVSSQKLAVGRILSGLAFVCFLTTLVLSLKYSSETVKAAPISTSSSSALPGQTSSVSIEPGDIELERDTSLLVIARITGPMPTDAQFTYWPWTEAEANSSHTGQAPADITFSTEPAGTQAPPETATQLAMHASLADPVFSVQLPRVSQSLQYQVSIGAKTYGPFTAKVFDYPQIERVDAQLTFPEFTQRPVQTVPNTRLLTVPEGTQVDLQITFNQPVAQFVCEPVLPKTVADAEPVFSSELKIEQVSATQQRISLEATQSVELVIGLTDNAGRENQKPEKLSIKVLPNQRPDLKITFPARDVEVSPLEELHLEAELSDDYGLLRSGLTYTFADQPPVEIILGENLAAQTKHPLSTQISLEEIQAAPHQLLAYYWWAEDLGPNGQNRRTESDLYFAEVRPFEEIFRQADPAAAAEQRANSSSGPSGGSAQQNELLELQKEIIAATWKVYRQSGDPTSTGTWELDVSSILQAQNSALEQAIALARAAGGPEQAGVSSQATEAQQAQLQDVILQMELATQHLQLALGSSAPEPLTAALQAEQAAYALLLNLRSSEHDIARQQQASGQSSSSSSARSDQQRQQLQQLDLTNEADRYETQRTAQELPEQTTEDRENRQTLNHLRELARRQQDINQRLQELQTALAAATPEEAVELQNQLKRLQEQQQEILDDTDQLQSQLQQSAQQDQTAQQRQQLEQTRQQVQQTAEALQQQEITQAAASGARAQEQFENLREEFRQRSASRFEDELRQIQRDAAQLEEQQQQLSQQLSVAPSTERSLRGDDPLQQLQQQVQQQRQRLEQLQNQVRETIEAAEETEPLLSSRLYDAVRDLQQHDLETTLQRSEDSLSQGLITSAQAQTANAEEAIREFRTAIDQAADAVLGSEAEALRRARDQLQNLASELEAEIRHHQQQNQQQTAGSPLEVSDESALETAEAPTPLESTSPFRENRASQQGSLSENIFDDIPGSVLDGIPDSIPNNAPAATEPLPSGSAPSLAGSNSSPENPSQQSAAPENGRPQPRSAEASSSAGSQQATGSQSVGSTPADSQPNGSQPNGSQSANSQSTGSPGSETGPSGVSSAPSARDPNASAQSGVSTESGMSESGMPESGVPGSGQPGGSGSTGGLLQDLLQPLTGGNRVYAPLTGNDFRDWSDRLRDVEEMVGDPQLRAEAAQIRQRARELRSELQRHAELPQWDVVQSDVVVPLVELQRQINQSLLRRTAPQTPLPLDRDPVPPRYSEKTRRYYERLGSGR